MFLRYTSFLIRDILGPCPCPYPPKRQDAPLNLCMKSTGEILSATVLGSKHCQTHCGPEGWVHITSSFTNLDQISLIDDFSSHTGGSNWLEVMIFRHLRGVPNGWKWWLFITDEGFHLTGSDDFTAPTGGPNWLEVMTFHHSQGVSTEWKWWLFVTHGGSQLTF